MPFDPGVHEAVAREEDPTVAVPTVVEELQRGYRIHERLLRPALLVDVLAWDEITSQELRDEIARRSVPFFEDAPA